jgi:hypothetical protein
MFMSFPPGRPDITPNIYRMPAAEKSRVPLRRLAGHLAASHAVETGS